MSRALEHDAVSPPHDHRNPIIRLSLFYIIVSPVFSVISVGGRSLSGLMAPLLLLAALPWVLQPNVGRRGHSSRESLYLQLFVTFYVLSLLWAVVVSAFDGFVLDGYFIQQLTAYMLFVVSVAMGARYGGGVATNEIAIAQYVRAATWFTALTTAALLGSMFMGTEYPYSPLLPGVAILTTLPFYSLHRREVGGIILVNMLTILAMGNRTVPVVVLGGAIAIGVGLKTRRLFAPWSIPAIGGLLLGAYVAYRPQSLSLLSERWVGGDQSLRIGSLALNTSGRYTVWNWLWESGQALQPWGGGLGAASRRLSSIFGYIEHPHNDYLRIWYDFGIIGACFMIVAMLTLLKGIGTKPHFPGTARFRIQLSSVAGIAAVTLLMFTLNPLVVTPLLVWVGLIVGHSLSGCDNAKGWSAGIHSDQESAA